VSYDVRLSRSAERALDRTDRPTELRLRQRLRELASDPYDRRLSKPLAGVQELRSARVGSWRIIFSADSAAQVLYVVRIQPRGQVYRGL
jgi:mRNA interferase RelE/StbE